MGKFTVLNFANNLTKEEYIRFGDTEEILCCSCHDWRKSLQAFFPSI